MHNGTIQDINIKKRVAFYTLGCKLNYAETSTLERQFNIKGFQVVPYDAESDVYVINTCSVTQDANRDCRKVVRRAQRRNPDAFIIVTGCYAQLEPEEIAAIKGVDLVLGASHKFDIFNLAGSFQKPDSTIIHHTDVNQAVDFHHSFSSSDRTRAFLKIQDGCDYKCAFCTIPLARGKSRSPSISQIVERAREVIKQGYKEVVLTGVNAGDFGKQNGESFFELIQKLDRLPGLKRIRISSIEPNLLSREIIEFTADSQTIQPHFHIPLQSGSNEILRLMKRRYDADLYRSRVDIIRNCLPDACIGADVITGHPGESDSHFHESLDFISSLDVSYLHVFTYSGRPHTEAFDMMDQVPKNIRKKRTFQLRKLSDQKRYDFDSRFIGYEKPVLLENDENDGWLHGWTDNYIRVAIQCDQSFVNHIVTCRLEKRNPSEVVKGILSGHHEYMPV